MVMPAIPVSDEAIIKLVNLGFSHAEIGLHLGMKTHTVSKRLSRAKHATPVTRRPTGPREASMIPELTLPRWDETGPCADEPPEMFFNTTPYAVRTAKEVCGGCPVRTQCLAGALEREEPWGVWGGEVFPEAVWAARRNRKKTA